MPTMCWPRGSTSAAASSTRATRARDVLDEELLSAIEKRHELTLPSMYRQMQLQGACEGGVLVRALDIEWSSLETVRDWIAPGYWSQAHVVLPFAKTGRGDLYAWVPAWAEHDELPVALVRRDSETCTVIAPHVEGLLYRLALEAVVAELPSEDMDDVLDEIGSYLRDAWRRDLERLATQPLDHAALEQRILGQLGFSRLGSTFRR